MRLTGIEVKIFSIDELFNVNVFVSPFPLAPYIGPPNMTADISGQTSAFISWLPISSSQVPGNLLGYRLRYKLYHDPRNESTVITLDAFTHNRVLTGLKAFRYYWIECVGFTKAGEGPHSLVVIKTPPGRV